MMPILAVRLQVGAIRLKTAEAELCEAKEESQVLRQRAGNKASCFLCVSLRFAGELLLLAPNCTVRSRHGRRQPLPGIWNT